MARFCPFPDNLSEDEHRSKGLVCLAQGISRQGNIPAALSYSSLTQWVKKRGEERREKEGECEVC